MGGVVARGRSSRGRIKVGQVGGVHAERAESDGVEVDG